MPTGRLSHERLPGCLVLSLERLSFLGKIQDQKINVKKMSDEQNCHNHFLLTRDFQIHERKGGTGQTDIKTIDSSLVERLKTNFINKPNTFQTLKFNREILFDQ